MGAEELGHGGVRMEGVAKGRVGREEVEEGEERGRGERKRVEVDEVDDVTGSEGWKDAFEGGRGMERSGFRSVDDGFGDCKENVILVFVEWP